MEMEKGEGTRWRGDKRGKLEEEEKDEEGI